MSFTTTVYFVFLLIGLVFYYLIPKNYRWTVLLVMSYIYYLVSIVVEPFKLDEKSLFLQVHIPVL